MAARNHPARSGCFEFLFEAREWTGQGSPPAKTVAVGILSRGVWVMSPRFGTSANLGLDLRSSIACLSISEKNIVLKPAAWKPRSIHPTPVKKEPKVNALTLLIHEIG